MVTKMTQMVMTIDVRSTTQTRKDVPRIGTKECKEVTQPRASRPVRSRGSTPKRSDSLSRAHRAASLEARVGMLKPWEANPMIPHSSTTSTKTRAQVASWQLTKATAWRSTRMSSGTRAALQSLVTSPSRISSIKSSTRVETQAPSILTQCSKETCSPPTII